MVTAELAMSIPALVVVVAMAVAGVLTMTDSMRCADAAATAARLAARGEPLTVVRSTALRAAPPGATLQVVTDGSIVTATVTDRVAGPGILRRFGAFTVSQHSVAAVESGAIAAPAS
ncbi:MAG TPA: TadE family type IV pilus minor pilin [Mycobacteriales bacterium]|nr:TadE family type IV pilus minor pilin [Mycobacteriales bacterium]